MSKATATAVYAGAWFSWLLDFVGWVILLSGLAAMQEVRIFSRKFPPREVPFSNLFLSLLFSLVVAQMLIFYSLEALLLTTVLFHVMSSSAILGG
jgi:hypothetical protein